jgi:hypothetical protein
LTESYYDTLKRHGVKLSLAMFLGNLLHTALLYAALLLYAILAVLLITMFSSVPSVLEADSNQVAESFASEPGGIVLGVVLLLLFVPAVQLRTVFGSPAPMGPHPPRYSAVKHPSASFLRRDLSIYGESLRSKSFWPFCSWDRSWS